MTLDGFRGSGADWLERFKPYIEDGKTVVASPHKVYGPENNDLVLQLRKRNISKVILGGMSANLCVEAHLHELLEQGLQVTVVKDATAGTQHPELGVWIPGGDHQNECRLGAVNNLCSHKSHPQYGPHPVGVRLRIVHRNTTEFITALSQLYHDICHPCLVS